MSGRLVNGWMAALAAADIVALRQCEGKSVQSVVTPSTPNSPLMQAGSDHW